MINQIQAVIHPENTKLAKAYAKIQSLIEALNKKGIPEEIADEINDELAIIDEHNGSEKTLLKAHRKANKKILKLVEEKLSFVQKGHYRNMWMALGIAFGTPFGVSFSFALDSMAFLGLGIPIGMGIGIAMGAAQDKKAERLGHQLDFGS